MAKFSVAVVTAVLVVTVLGGCAVLGGGRASFASERVRVASVVEGIKKSLPAELIISEEMKETVLSCGGGNLITGGGDGTQVNAHRFIVVAPEFDAEAWLDAQADEYEARPHWEVDRHRNNKSVPGRMRNVYWAPAGNSISVGVTPGVLTDTGFNGRDDAVGEPAQQFTISASAECADKPANWDGFGDFLEETPLPSPLPSVPAE